MAFAADTGQLTLVPDQHLSQTHGNGFPAVPTFASARAADVILSDVRATSITPDALRAVNILLDELLWLILSNARSLDLLRLKTGVLKTIPTQLGKDAILEAEIEIRAYRDKTHSRPRTARPSEDILSAFPLQEAFEFLRLKCQVLSSFGEIEEDPILENRLLDSYTTASPLSPSQDFTEPAPLYVTAVIEHVCQHVLGNIAKVVARDSSRTAADLVILYTSLCEDSSIYPIFKTMKVQSHIQAHIKPNTLTRTQSITPPEEVRPAPPNTPLRRRETSAQLGARRPSVESTVSSNPRDVNNGNGKRSTERNRVMRIFRSSSDINDEANGRRSGPHQRSESIRSEGAGRLTASPDQNSVGEKEKYSANDEGSTQFEDLLDSGSTMKVSLTPDRLKTFEVFSKEKNLRLNRTAGSSSISLTGRIDNFKAGTADTKPKSPSGSRIYGRESSIDEDRELPDVSVQQPRGRTASLARFMGKNTLSNDFDAPVSPGRPSNASTIQPQPSLPIRQNSTESKTHRPRASTLDPSIVKHRLRKMSLIGSPALDSSTITEDSVSQRLPDVSPPTSSNLLPGFPSSIPRLRKTMAGSTRNRESLDLDEIMDGDDDGDVNLEDGSVSRDNGQGAKPSPPRSPQKQGDLQLKSATTNGPSTTREILKFLDQGPPDDEYASSVVSAAVSTVSTTKSKAGRLMSMMSKLRGGTSNDKVGRSAAANASMSYPSILQTSSKGPFASSPTLAVPPPLRRPKSVHNLAGSNRYAPSSWIPPTPPPPPQPPRPEPLRADLPPRKPADLPTPTVSPPPSKESFSAQVEPVSPPPLPSPVSMQFKALGPPSRKNSLNRKPVPTLILTSGQSEMLVRSPADPVPQTNQPLSPRKPRLPIHPEMNGSPELTQELTRDDMAPNSGTDEQMMIHFRQPRTPTSPNTPNKCSTGPTLSPVDETSSPASSSVTLDKNEQATPSLPHDDPLASQAHRVDPDSTDWISRAAELRKAMIAARHVGEARLLVDMFFARWGIPVNDPDPVPVPLPKETLTDPSPSLSFIADEHTVIEALLGDGDFITVNPPSS